MYEEWAPCCGHREALAEKPDKYACLWFAFCLWLGCDAPTLPQPAAAEAVEDAKPNASAATSAKSAAAAPAKAAPAAKPAAVGQAMHAEDKPPEHGVTSFAIESTPNSYVCGGLEGKPLKLSAADGTKFGTAVNQHGTIIFTVQPEEGDGWQLHLRAPKGKPFEAKMYADGVRADVSEEDKPWIWLTSGSRGPSRTTGWFRIHESKFAANNKRIERFAVDFVLVEHDGSKSFGRYRLRAAVDPQPSAEEIKAALYGTDAVAKEKAGLELVVDGEIEYGLSMFNQMNGRHPASMEELMNEVVKQYPMRLPKPPEGKELWYDAKEGRLYIREVSAAGK